VIAGLAVADCSRRFCMRISGGGRSLASVCSASAGA